MKHSNLMHKLDECDFTIFYRLKSIYQYKGKTIKLSSSRLLWYFI
jgi:hypothetical protein